MTMTTIDQTFLGTGWSFPPEFERRAKVVKMSSDEDDIRESLKILLSTSPGERVMQPTYGCGLKALIFENMSESTLTEIKDVIERAVLFFEPRINLEGIEVNTDGIYDGLIKIQLDYTIRTTNTRSNMVYPYYFLEGTNVRS
jgi:phage baseplate assembly protein W